MKQLQKFPFFSQLDNANNPYGSCNVTSVAMCLHYFGIRGNGNGQLEDQMYERMARNGWSRHQALDLKKLIESYPDCKDTFTEAGTLQMIRDAIAQGKPCILHGYFTRGGHIITVKGFDERGFIVNDPYGEWYPSGYDTSVSGEGLHYSNSLIARVCSPESIGNPKNIYLHVVGRN